MAGVHNTSRYYSFIQLGVDRRLYKAAFSLARLYRKIAACYGVYCRHKDIFLVSNRSLMRKL